MRLARLDNRMRVLVSMICAWRCCRKEFEPVKSFQRYCRANCKTAARVQETRRRNKVKAVAFLGGKCVRCGYCKSLRALSFHHRDRDEKKFTIAQRGISWERMKAELVKCELVCANCHMEEEEAREAAKILAGSSVVEP